MATVNISFDTKTKKCSVTMNGSPVSNVQEIMIHKGYDVDSEDQYMMDLILKEENKDEGVRVMTNVMARKKELEEKYEGSVSLLDNYQPIDKKKLSQSIANMMGKK